MTNYGTFRKEYNQKVGEYSKKRSTDSYMATSMGGLSSLFVGSLITVAVCNATDYLPASTNLIIGLSVFFAVAITTVLLMALIYEKTKAKGMQHSKDWEAGISNKTTLLRRDSSENYTPTTGNALKISSAAINI